MSVGCGTVALQLELSSCASVSEARRVRRWHTILHSVKKTSSFVLSVSSPMPPTTSPQESDTSSFDSSSDDDDHLHPSAQAEEVKVSTIDDNLFNMSLDSAGNPVPTTRSQLNSTLALYTCT